MGCSGYNEKRREGLVLRRRRIDHERTGHAGGLGIMDDEEEDNK